MLPPTPTKIPLEHGKSANPDFFTRMFDLPAWPGLGSDMETEEALRNLAAAMRDIEGADGSKDNPDIPAGFTYLGQFVDHDITFDPTGIPARAVRPEEVRNFRTPGLDLDSVYGLGPDIQPYLYKRGGKRAKFKIGRTSLNPGGGDPDIAPGMPHDLPRIGRAPEDAAAAGQDAARTDAVIGDKRNDENLIVAQTHLAFLRFHNAVVDKLVADGHPESGLFAAARQTVTWHYQWVVLNDFVHRLVDPEVFALFSPIGSPAAEAARRSAIPVEFSAAAYRMGHSMVRETYDFNRVFRDGGVTPATLQLLFRFSGLSGSAVPIPSDWIIDWRRFYDFGDDVEVNPSRRIDPLLADTLHRLPEGGALPELNLRRGFRLGLPSGQSVADALGVGRLSEEQIATGPDGEAAAAHGMHRATPLWYYILKEAQILGGPNIAGSIDGGRRLGPVGSHIVCSTFFGLVDGDPNSYRRAGEPWLPTLQEDEDDDFAMVDLLTFAGDLNPIDDD